MLNQDPATAVAVSGPGSTGQETSYYGALTAAAISRFQEKYYLEVLAPNGLSSGTGAVGPSTLKALNEVAAAKTVSPAASYQPAYPPSTATAAVPKTQSAVVTGAASSRAAPANPNLKNLPTFFADLDAVSAKQNIPAAQVALIKSQVAKIVATTTDLTKEFEGIVGPSVSDSKPKAGSLASLWDQAVESLTEIFAPQKALAQGALEPFGGKLLLAIPCTCTGGSVWNITIQPLPPKYATLLDYVEGTQMYLEYNTPLTTELLGKYQESGGNICYIGVEPYCFQLPAEGLITPTVGSSL